MWAIVKDAVSNPFCTVATNKSESESGGLFLGSTRTSDDLIHNGVGLLEAGLALSLLASQIGTGQPEKKNLPGTRSRQSR